MTPSTTLLLLLLAFAFGYLAGIWLGPDVTRMKQDRDAAFNRGWNEGQRVGARPGRRDGWFAAHKLALDSLRETPFSAPMKKLVKVLAMGEQPITMRPTEMTDHNGPLKLVATTTHAHGGRTGVRDTHAET